MIHTLEKFPGNVVAFLCTGRVTKRDYDVVLIPAVAAAFARHRGIRLYYQTTDDFRMDSGAAWEDLKVGMEYLTRWERIAIVTDVDWLRHAVRAFSFLLTGRIKLFPGTEADEARQWITASRETHADSAA